MATAVKRLDLAVGELVEIAGRRYEVVPDREGGVTIEPPITPAAQLHARRGTKPASPAGADELGGEFEGRGHADGLEGDVGAEAVGQLHHCSPTWSPR